MTEKQKSPIVKVFDGLIKVLVGGQRLILVLTSAGLALSVAMMAILRYLFQINLFGIEEFVLMCGIWLYFMGAANGSFEKSQISASVIDIFVKNKTALWWISIIQQVITVGLFVVFCFYGLDFIQFSIEAGSRTQVHKIPYWISHIAITISIFLMTLYTLMYLVKDIVDKVRSKKQPDSPAEPVA